MNRHSLILTLCLAFGWAGALAQPGMVDPTYNVNDTGTGIGPDLYIHCSGVQSTGKVIVGGYFEYFDFHPSNSIVRLNVDGTADLSFDIGAGFNGTVSDLIVLPDDRILIGGDFTSFNGVACGKLAMLNPDGTLDATFNAGGAGPNYQVQKVFRQTDGYFVIAGRFTQFNGTPYERIVRLDANGGIDPSFNVGYGFQGFSDFMGGYISYIRSINQQPDGKLLIGGTFVGYDSIPSNGLVRIMPDGGFDATFNVGSGIAGTSNDQTRITHIEILPDGRMMLCGNFQSYNGQVSPGIARISADGSFDPGFNVGTGYGSGCGKSFALADGELLALGSSTYNGSPVSYLAVLDSNGTYVSAFNAGSGPNAGIGHFLPLPNGQFVAIGSFTTFDGLQRNKMALLEANATVVPGFREPTGFDGYLTAIEAQADGKAMVGGSFTRNGPFAVNDLMRLMPDGTVDFSFNAGLGVNGDINAIAVQTDGKYLVGGSYITQYNGESVGPLFRLHPNGTRDTSYNVTLNGYLVYAIEMQPDGKALVAGQFTTVNGQSAQNIVRFNSDGTVDPTFNHSAQSSFIRCMAVQPDGRILVGGNQTYFSVALLARLMPDGTVDPSFDTGSGMLGGFLPDIDHPQTGAEVRDLMTPPPPPPPSEITSISVMSDGRILLTSNWVAAYDSIPVPPVFLLNADGSLSDQFQLDTNVNIPIGIHGSGVMRRSLLQSDDRPIVYGSMSTSALSYSPRVFRLNVDGSLDPDFYLAQGATHAIYDMTLTVENKILAVGAFIGFNVMGRSRIVQLLNDGMLVDEAEVAPAVSADHPDIYFSAGMIHVVGGEGSAELTVFDMMGRGVLTAQTNGTHAMVPAHLSAGMYVVRHVAASGTYAAKVVLRD
jgi:uncharacterized delta-60 repeat protein